MYLWKYHGLGNDYLVAEPGNLRRELSEDFIRLLCHRHYGAGSDGILLGPVWPWMPDFKKIVESNSGVCQLENDLLCGLRIFNPDGSEAEKSGNGLRIFARHLYERHGLQKGQAQNLLTLGGQVTVTVHDPRESIEVTMGEVTFNSRKIPMTGPEREAVNEEIEVNGRKFRFCAASVGNPHCVVLDVAEEVSADFARKYGPYLENAPIFPQRTNVQFLRVLGAHDLAMEIWERGAGYTLASGSSASATAAAAVRLGMCKSPVTVHMPGGKLKVQIDANQQVTQIGPVKKVGCFAWQADE